MAFAAAVRSTSGGHRAFQQQHQHQYHYQHQQQHSHSYPSQAGTGMSDGSGSPGGVGGSGSIGSGRNGEYNDQRPPRILGASISPPSSVSSISSHGVRNNTGNMAMASSSTTPTPDSPQLIKCSTCMSLVSLLDMGEHICSAPSNSTSTSTSTSTPISVSSPSQLPSPHSPQRTQYASYTSTAPSRAFAANSALPNSNGAHVAPGHGRLGSGFSHTTTTGGVGRSVPTPITRPYQQSHQSQQNSRNMLNPLRVNVSHAPGQFEAPLPTPYRTPLPRSPSNYSHSPSPATSPAGTNLSPGYPFTGTTSKFADRTAHQLPHQQPQFQVHQHQHQRYPSSNADVQYQQPRSPHYPAHDKSNDQQHQQHHQHPSDSGVSLSHSPSSRSVGSNISSDGNNAGIGARLPFYEKIQQQQQQQRAAAWAGGSGAGGGSPVPISPALSSPTGGYYSPPHSAGLQGPGQGQGKSVPHHQQRPSPTVAAFQRQQEASRQPRSPISPGWSGLANEPDETHEYFAGGSNSGSRDNHDQLGREQNNRVLPQPGKIESENSADKLKSAHVRETSESGQSSVVTTSYSDHLDYFLKDESSPDTSPEVTESAVFRSGPRADTGEMITKDKVEDSSQLISEDRLQEDEEEDDGSHDYADDIIDSYPTPQPHFSGRFGGLVVDEDLQDDYLNRMNRHQQQQEHDRDHHHSRQDENDITSLLSGGLKSMALGRTQSDKQHANPYQQGSADIAPPMSVSRSFPSNLSSAAQDAPCYYDSASSSIGKNDAPKQRLISDDNPSQLPTFNNIQTSVKSASESGGGLDACMDDLLKEMNRDSSQTISAVVPPLASQLRQRQLSNNEHSPTSTTPTSPKSFASRIPFGRSNSERDRPQQHPESERARERTRTPVATAPICGSCSQPIKTSPPVERDGQCFCTECYAQLYLPKCRKCRLPIEDKAIGSTDGKVKGKFHVGCFSCFLCSAPFPTGDFYVFANRPYCAQHYHERNGTLCANSLCSEEQRGIEGPCVSLVGEESGNGGRYHPTCFRCSDGSCRLLLDQYHYVLNSLPYCESHAREIEDREIIPEPSRSVSPPNGGHDAYYNVDYGSSTSSQVTDRRRSASLDIPAQSLNALRKNAQSPNYRGMVSRRTSGRRRPSDSSWVVPQQPSSFQSQIRGNGPPPVNSMRRAEKRRTIISQIRLR